MGLLDAISPTPRNRILGLLADATQGVNDFASKPFGYDNPPARMLMGLLGVPSIATTLDRLSYGEPLTNIGKANVPLLKPETADAAMAAAAALPAVSRGALKASDAAVRAITKNPEATATKVMDYAAQMNPMNPMVVYHGSPHKFDKFDSSKIGTGEGAQAYGHGLYLAESPDVAGSYVQSVKANSSELVKRGASHGLPDDVASNLAAALQSGKKFDPVIDAARAMVNDPLTSQAQRQAAQRLIDNEMAAYNAWSDWSKPGSLYKVDLPDSAIAKMLDWDAPLSKQAPEVQKSLQSLVGDVTSGGFDLTRAPRNVRNAFDSSALQAAESALASKYGATKTPAGWVDKSGKPISQDSVDKMLAKLGGKSYENAGQLYNDLAHIVGSQSDVSATLRNLGVPGIKYLDGGSRAAGIGTKNFVVFPGGEGLLNILERNGSVLP